ncbi:TIGR03759 family integrating conjugative element protein [Legionella sp. CNM-4043-24]|uniref:TIGR03759 family integrating conjugative element protein n=1 Tax=Legionella sp. CNM-4043-24 TaxID=3421646 RepID=UPI00403A879E
MNKYTVLMLSLLATQSAFAELNIPGLGTQALNTLAVQDQTLARAGLEHNEDDVTADQDLNTLKLNEQQLHEAKVWELTPEEEKRYVLLMQNRSKIYYEGLRQTPLDILGLNARSESERNHFAELAARQEAQKVTKNIAWNNAFYKAYNKLFANVPVIGDFDPSPFSPYQHKSVQLTPGDTLYFFITTDDAATGILMVLMDAIEDTPDTHLNLMLLESDDLAIQLWANKHQIPKHLVSSARVTLNHGDMNYQALKLNKKSTPLLLLSKNGHSSIVDLGRF